MSLGALTHEPRSTHTGDGTMKTTITQLTRDDQGILHESGDMAPDILHESAENRSASDIADDFVADLGYEYASGFGGWGLVLRHTETEELLSFCD